MSTYMKDKEQDKFLREAIERRAANVPPLSEDFAERVMGKLEVRRRKGRRTIALWVSSIAAILLVGFFIFVNRPKEQPVVALNTEKPEKHEEPQPEPTNVEPENLAQSKKIFDVSNRSTRRVESSHSTCLVEQHNVPDFEEPLQASLETEQEVSPSPSERIEGQLVEEPVILPEKQALVDIYLAEELLQVAYQQQEQTEPLRAYIATLLGEEPETSHQIISF